jgi:hypothetical protein
LKSKLLIPLVLVLALMGFTNPNLDDYREFLRQSIIEASQKDSAGAMARVTGPLLGGLASSFVASQTVRTNWLLFSTYKTQFMDDKLTAIGAFKNFMIIERPNFKQAPEK